MITHNPAYNVHNAVMRKVAELCLALERSTGFRLVQQVIVKPDEHSPQPLAPIAPGVSFLMIMGTCTQRFMERRPTEKQMEKLINWFMGEKPRWMEDVLEKEQLWSSMICSRRVVECMRNNNVGLQLVSSIRGKDRPPPLRATQRAVRCGRQPLTRHHLYGTLSDRSMTSRYSHQ